MKTRKGPIPSKDRPSPTAPDTSHGSAKPADEPQFNIAANASARGLVLIAIGTGADGYSITPERAVAVANELLTAAAEAASGEE